MPAQWLSVDPRNGNCVQYSGADARTLETAYVAGQPQAALVLGGATFTVTFSDMRQFNANGGSRQVLRLCDEDDEDAPAPVAAPAAAPATVTPDFVRAVLAQVAHADAAIADVEKHEASRRYTVSAASFGAVGAVEQCFELIIAGLASPRQKQRNGFQPGDESLLHIKPGQQVPAYYANVSNGSIWNRKMLSVLGLRNLVAKGPQVFNDMRAQLFSGDPSSYGPRSGPNAMKYFTGSVVDLDTVVLRCHEQATIDAVNQQLPKGKPKLRSSRAVADSDTANEIARHSATVAIAAFRDRLKITDAEAGTRRLNLLAPGTPLPVATDNSTRGKHAMWRYDNVSVLTIHANVPNLDDVYGALLKAPFHLAHAFAMLHQIHGSDPQALQQALDNFYEGAVSDSCFNGKWKAIEEFCKDLAKHGTIADVLNKLQQQHQAIFTADFFDADDDEGTNTLAEMIRLVQQHKPLGVDPKTQRHRDITKADVEEWHKVVMGVA